MNIVGSTRLTREGRGSLRIREEIGVAFEQAACVRKAIRLGRACIAPNENLSQRSASNSKGVPETRLHLVFRLLSLLDTELL